MNCPKCGCDKYTKNGKVNAGKQRYKCKECSYNFTTENIGLPKELKRFALMLYLEGLGFRSIERILGVSNVTVMRWIKKFGKELEELKSSENRIEWVELDELHTYIHSKKTIAGFGLLLTGMENGLSTAFLVQGEKKPL